MAKSLKKKKKKKKTAVWPLGVKSTNELNSSRGKIYFFLKKKRIIIYALAPPHYTFGIQNGLENIQFMTRICSNKS
jgi:hypothetical protein